MYRRYGVGAGTVCGPPDHATLIGAVLGRGGVYAALWK